MSHFAKIDENGTVLTVIVAEQDFINSGAVGDSFLWVQTSYNNNFRKQYAATGGTYDKVNDIFIGPQPYDSWTLDASFDWQPPTAIPDDGGLHVWNEDTKEWFIPDDDTARVYSAGDTDAWKLHMEPHSKP